MENRVRTGGSENFPDPADTVRLRYMYSTYETFVIPCYIVFGCHRPLFNGINPGGKGNQAGKNGGVSPLCTQVAADGGNIPDIPGIDCRSRLLEYRQRER